MMMLAALVRRGGRPAAVAPTIALRPGERQYGWFPVTVDPAGRRIAIITNQRLIVGEDYPLAAVDRVRPVPGEWSVALTMRDRREPLLLSGPWVPWMSVVICAELYGTAWPPEEMPARRHDAGLDRPHPGPERRRVGRERHVGKTAGKLLIASVDRSATGCDA
jgi:hypothetical protein